GEDVPEEVVGHDHVVALRGRHQVHAGGVDVVVGRGDVGKLQGNLIEGSLPKVTCEGKHVGLVNQRQVPAVPGPGQIEGEPYAALHSEAGVDRSLGRDLGHGPPTQEASLAGIGALGVLSDHGDVNRDAGAGAGGGHKRPQVDVQIELEAHVQHETP